MQRIDKQNLSETGWMVIERLTERLKALATFSVEDLLLLSKSYQKEIKMAFNEWTSLTKETTFCCVSILILRKTFKAVRRLRKNGHNILNQPSQLTLQIISYLVMG